MVIGVMHKLLDNGVVSLKGLIVRRHGAFNSNGVEKIEDENKYSLGLNKNLGFKSKKACANAAIRHGQKFIKHDKSGKCTGGQYYNTIKPSRNDFRKDMSNYPGTIDRGSIITIKKPDGTKLVVKSANYSKLNYPWQGIYEEMEGYKLTLLPKSVTDGNCYIGVSTITRSQME